MRHIDDDDDSFLILELDPRLEADVEGRCSNIFDVDVVVVIVNVDDDNGGHDGRSGDRDGETTLSSKVEASSSTG